jgi:Na+(H+)/acetate symporter ActP
MSQPITHLRGQVAKAAILSAVVSVVLIGLTYGVASVSGKPQVAYDIAMSGGLLLLASMPALLLSVLLTGRVRGGASIGFVAGIAVRLPVGGVLALYGLNWGLAQSQSFPQIVAGMYLVLLVVEVVCISPAVKRTAAAEARIRSEETSSHDDQESV